MIRYMITYENVLFAKNGLVTIAQSLSVAIAYIVMIGIVRMV